MLSLLARTTRHLESKQLAFLNNFISYACQSNFITPAKHAPILVTHRKAFLLTAQQTAVDAMSVRGKAPTGYSASYPWRIPTYRKLSLCSHWFYKSTKPFICRHQVQSPRDRAASFPGVCASWAEAGRLGFVILLWTQGLGTVGLGGDGSIHPPWAGPLQRRAAPLC